MTTAIDKGEHKVPEGHKCTLYALAPGEAMVIGPWSHEFERSVMKITEADARRAKYRYLLSWLEGRTVAEFDLDGRVLAQPVFDDPKERRKRGNNEGDHEAVREGPGAAPEGVGGDGPPVPALLPAARRRGRVPVQEETPQEAPEPRRKPRKEKPRKEKPPVEWL